MLTFIPEAQDSAGDDGDGGVEFDDIQWNERPSDTIFGTGTYEFDVAGPIGIQPTTATFLVDGIIFYVNWFGLNEYGDITQKIEVSPPFGDIKGQRGGGHVRNPILGENKIQRFDPPLKDADGYRVQIIVPIQPAFHDISMGVDLKVFVKRGSRLIPVGQR